MNIGHRFVCSLVCVCLGGEDMRLGGLHWSWRVSGEANDTFASRKRWEALDARREADAGEDVVRGTDAIMEDP
jgi:hypothetical protein